MKHTKQWLIDHNMDFSSLSHELGISVKDYGDRVVLNYSQIESPKTHPVVRECRGAIMSKSGEVICRPFDRFYNLGEAPETQEHLDINRTIAVEKLDGSLIKLYHWNGSWELAYFPQEREFFEPYYKTLFVFLELLECEYNRVKNIIDQKEFAIAVKELPYASALFSARKTGKSVVQCFHDSRMEWKVGMLKDLVKE